MMSLSFFDREIDDATVKHEQELIGETPESRINGLESLRKKLLQIEDLRPQLDDEFLLRFLRIAKFDVKKACERIQKYYKVRIKYSTILKEFYPSAAKTTVKTGYFLASPRRAANHSIVFVLKRGMCEPSKIVYEDMLLMNCLIFDFLNENPLTQICCANIILDFAGYSFRQLITDTPGRVRMAIDTMQNTFPMRYKSVHILNATRIFLFLQSLFFPFVPKKIKERYFFHSDWESLHYHLPPEILPEAYGGTIPDSDMIDLTDEIMKRDSQYKEQLQYGFIQKK